MINKFLTWLVVSSANPNEFSMTLKGLLITNIGVIMFILHICNISLSMDQVTNLIGLVTGFCGSALLVVGLIRKIYLTIKKPADSQI